MVQRSTAALRPQRHRRLPLDEPRRGSGDDKQYDNAMSVATGTVRDGKIVVEGPPLPEGTVVTILTDDDSPAVGLPADLERELQEAIDEADREEGGAGPEFLESLKQYD